MAVLTDTDFDDTFRPAGTVESRLQRSAESGPGTDDERWTAGARIILSWVVFGNAFRRDLMIDWLEKQSGPTYEGALVALKSNYYDQNDARTMLRALGGYAGGCG